MKITERFLSLVFHAFEGQNMEKNVPEPNKSWSEVRRLDATIHTYIHLGVRGTTNIHTGS